MRINELLLTLHILAMATWIGAALALQVIAAHVRPVTPDAVVDEFAIDAEAVGKKLLAPAAVVLLATGVALVVRPNHDWSDLWILVGIGALIAAGAIGGAFLVPEGRRIAELARTRGHDPQEIRDRTRRRFLVARVDLFILTICRRRHGGPPGQLMSGTKRVEVHDNCSGNSFRPTESTSATT